MAISSAVRCRHSRSGVSAERRTLLRSKSAALSRDAATPKAANKPRKLSFKETRELEGMEAVVIAAEENIARIEALFLEPDFHRRHGQRTHELTAELAAEKKRVIQLYERWQELEAIRAGTPENAP